MRLLSRLSEAQHHHGYLSEAILRELAQREHVPLYRLQELVSFYPHFRTSPPSRVSLHVCRDVSCKLAGCESILNQLKDLALDGVEIQEVSCLGRCDQAPAMTLNERPICGRAVEVIRQWMEQPDTIPEPIVISPQTPQCDPYPDPRQRYGTIRRYLAPTPDNRVNQAIAELKASELRGMGGAGFPTGVKWELVRKESRTPKYVICNADESEPGTFKDRELLARVPHLVLEGMMLAGWVVGAERGIIYLRHEYEPERRRLEQARQFAYSEGLLGVKYPSGFRFDIEIFVSPGGYILGEETALLEALEDKRGEPRNKPPFPGTHGLHGCPTLINNVETLAMSACILNRGADWWKSRGRPGFSGLKWVSVSGDVAHPGVFEIAMGTTVREIIDLAGGMKDGKRLLAFAPGGASSNFLPAEKADIPMDFTAMAKAGSMLGSGALIVVAEGADLLEVATNVVRFFRNESCGKCVPCRIGSQKAVEILEDVHAGKRDRTALQILPELGETMTQTSICGLGQVALNPILSVLQNFPQVIPEAKPG